MVDGGDPSLILFYLMLSWCSFGKSHGFQNEIVMPIRTNTSSILGLFPVVMRLYGVHDLNDQFGGPVPIIDVLYRKQWMTYKVRKDKALTLTH